MDFTRFTHISFDCYGTLIDWESGILDALRPMLERHGAQIDESRLLQLYAQHEARIEAGPFLPYSEVLRRVVAGIGHDLGFQPSEPELDALPLSVGDWPPFDDTVEALRALASRFELVVISNIDDALFARTEARLGVSFTALVSAEQVGAYKPSRRNFERTLERLGIAREQILHVAQSLYHDHTPAKELGWTTVRIDRPSRCAGTGVAPPARATPDLVVGDLRSLVGAVVGGTR